jgi:hypothetical protein
MAVLGGKGRFANPGQKDQKRGQAGKKPVR